MSTVLVTGAASGIGAAVVDTLVAAGVRTLCMDLDPIQAGSALGSGEQRVPLTADVTDEQQVEAVLSTVEATADPLLGVVHCAGISRVGLAEDLDVEVVRRVLEVNVVGSFIVARAVGRRLRAQGTGGRIVLMGSINSRIALPGQAAYATSKGAVLLLGQVLAVEWAADAIAVNTIGPGPTTTPLLTASRADTERWEALIARSPAGRAASPQEVAEVARYLVLEVPTYVTGAYLPVDGGWLASGGGYLRLAEPGR
jgi:NAD(P)-dependent dehydrogenase (short-subunit alcohol dehydrogenase family)